MAIAAPVVGGVAFMVGVVGIFAGGGESSWAIFVLGGLTALVGSAVFAVATFRAGILSRSAAVLIAVGSPLILLATSGLGEQALGALSLALFATGWFGLGVHALRLDRRSASPRGA
jgi:hypothetical protein